MVEMFRPLSLNLLPSSLPRRLNGTLSSGLVVFNDKFPLLSTMRVPVAPAPLPGPLMMHEITSYVPGAKACAQAGDVDRRRKDMPTTRSERSGFMPRESPQGITSDQHLFYRTHRLAPVLFRPSLEKDWQTVSSATAEIDPARRSKSSPGGKVPRQSDFGMICIVLRIRPGIFIFHQT